MPAWRRVLSTAVAAIACRLAVLSTTDHGHRVETELLHVHLELVRGCVRGVGVELEGLPVDPSLDARGSERSLEVALADPAEGSDDVADDLDDSALSATASHGGHGCGEAARTDFEAAEQCSHRALHLYAKCGDSYEPRVSQRFQRVPGVALAIPA